MSCKIESWSLTKALEKGVIPSFIEVYKSQLAKLVLPDGLICEMVFKIILMKNKKFSNFLLSCAGSSQVQQVIDLHATGILSVFMLAEFPEDIFVIRKNPGHYWLPATIPIKQTSALIKTLTELPINLKPSAVDQYMASSWPLYDSTTDKVSVTIIDGFEMMDLWVVFIYQALTDAILYSCKQSLDIWSFLRKNNKSKDVMCQQLSKIIDLETIVLRTTETVSRLIEQVQRNWLSKVENGIPQNVIDQLKPLYETIDLIQSYVEIMHDSYEERVQFLWRAIRQKTIDSSTIDVIKQGNVTRFDCYTQIRSLCSTYYTMRQSMTNSVCFESFMLLQ